MTFSNDNVFILLERNKIARNFVFSHIF